MFNLTKIKKDCKICGTSFQPKANNQVCCSPDCSHRNNRNLKRESAIRSDRDGKLRDFSKDNKIPIRYVEQCGIKFLKENKTVLEAFQSMVKLSGHFTHLSEEEIAVRRKATRLAAQERNLIKKRKKRASGIIKEHICKICGNTFTKINADGSAKVHGTTKTCSKECSEELHRIQSNEAGQRQRNKLKQQLKKKNNGKH